MSARAVVTVLGSGAWGAAFGKAVAGGCDVVFWDKNSSAAAAAAAGADAVAESDFAAAVAAADLIIIAVSSGGFAEVAARMASLTAAPFAWLTKGFEPRTARPLSAVAAELRGDGGAYAAISGPSFAEEVAAGLPTALMLAAGNMEAGLRMRDMLTRKNLRLYADDDITGVGVGGAVKNIIAIAAGICDAMRLGDNARAALITRGLAEMSAIGEALGGRRRTFLGLAGVGDLVLTCASDKSRNRRLGLAVGARASHCHTAADVAALTAATCEGVTALPPVLRLAERCRLSVPIIDAVAGVLRRGLSPAAALEGLLARPLPPA